MDDKELIEWLEREGAINIQTNARPHFKAAASRLRELRKALNDIATDAVPVSDEEETHCRTIEKYAAKALEGK